MAIVVFCLLLTTSVAISAQLGGPAVPEWLVPTVKQGTRVGAAPYHNLTVQVPMRDGVLLNTLLCIPDAASKASPVGTVVMRTPYGAAAAVSTAMGYAEFGWVGVVQDARGRFESGGNWSFWRTAAADGEDTFAWLAAQPWSNGRFATTGVSAPGIDSYVQALGQPAPYPGLVAQFNVVGEAVLHQTAYQGGAYREALMTGWLDAIGEASFVPQLMLHEAWSPWWNTTTMAAPGQPGVVPWSVVGYPVIHVGGWYDIFSTTQTQTYEGFLSAGRAPQYYVMDPGGHCGGGAIKWPNATWGVGVANDFSLALFTGALGNQLPTTAFADPTVAAAVESAARVFAETPVLLYVLGPGTLGSLGNVWVGLPALPPTQPLRLFFAPTNTLTLTPPTVPGYATFKSDPAHPVPTLGGNNLMIKPCGPQDQSRLEAEHAASMVVFTSEPLDATLVVCGPIVANVSFVTDAVDVDIAVTLLDVFPLGEAMLVQVWARKGRSCVMCDTPRFDEPPPAPATFRLQDGITRARWRNGPFATSPALLTPGQTYSVEVSIGDMCYAYNKGHRVRVTVQGSNAPRFSVNRNNGAPVSDNTTAAFVAETAVLFGGASPSSITLPIASAPEVFHRVYT
jgi:uncharacterized protein